MGCGDPPRVAQCAVQVTSPSCVAAGARAVVQYAAICTLHRDTCGACTGGDGRRTDEHLHYSEFATERAFSECLRPPQSNQCFVERRASEFEHVQLVCTVLWASSQFVRSLLASLRLCVPASVACASPTRTLSTDYVTL